MVNLMFYIWFGGGGEDESAPVIIRTSMCIFFYLSSNRDFLPRGSGIVTRRPLILQLLSDNTGKRAHRDVMP